MARITIEQAKALADDWKAQREDRDRLPTADYFRHATAHDLIKMLETGKGTDGKKLTKREFGCLMESWAETFGDLPHFDTDAATPEPAAGRAPEPLPAPDTMLRMADVERLTGITKSTIKRMIKDGRFPRPMKLGERAIGWLTSDVRTHIATLDEQRRRTMQ